MMILLVSSYSNSWHSLWLLCWSKTLWVPANRPLAHHTFCFQILNLFVRKWALINILELVSALLEYLNMFQQNCMRFTPLLKLFSRFINYSMMPDSNWDTRLCLCQHSNAWSDDKMSTTVKTIIDMVYKSQ